MIFTKKRDICTHIILKNVWIQGVDKWLQPWYVWNDVLHDIRQKIRYRQYPCLTSSVFDTHLFVFVSENIRIRIRSYPYSNLNPNKNMKTNMISVISVRIRSDYVPKGQLGGSDERWWAIKALLRPSTLNHTLEHNPRGTANTLVKLGGPGGDRT
jgi:hypothetical protein